MSRLLHRLVLSAARSLGGDRSVHAGTMARGSMIKNQTFGGSPLTRGLRRGQTLETALQTPHARFLPVSERRVGVDRQNSVLTWLSAADLASLGLTLDPVHGTVTAAAGTALAVTGAVLEAPDAAATGTGGTATRTLVPLYLLGKDVSNGTWSFAVDVTGVEALATGLADLRRSLPGLAIAELAVAGQAVALAQWHANHGFCPRCGAKTEAAEAGARRQCSAHDEHRLYPRTDPVVIMLVESPDGDAALLGKARAHQAINFLTCLSGFVDQCESIEEAVRREVLEEAGLEVEHTEILGSQPWPIGRAGSCELMIGCIARAKSFDLFVDKDEMETVQWVSKDDVRAAVLKHSQSKKEGLEGQDSSLSINVPPPFAIAHHLLKFWAERSGPWFTEVPASKI